MAGIAAISYSDALFALALEEEKSDLIKDQLSFVDKQMQENKEFLSLMMHPKIHKEQKKQVLQEIFVKQLDRTMLNFLKLLTDKGRFHDLHEICKEYCKRYNEENNIAVAEVCSARSLHQEEVQKIQTMLEKKLNKQVEMHIRIDEDLLAGVRIKINDVVLDHTAWNKMEHLKRLAINADREHGK